VLSDPTVARADTDGEGAVARGIPEVVSRRGELRGIFDQAALAGWFCVSWLWKVPRRRFYRHVSFEALLGLATHHEPTGYWDIIKRDNPRKSASRPHVPRLLHIDEPESTG
jgi:hypothetical protein